MIVFLFFYMFFMAAFVRNKLMMIAPEGRNVRGASIRARRAGKEIECNEANTI